MGLHMRASSSFCNNLHGTLSEIFKERNAAANKRWSTVSEPFHFPSSFTSKSWTLRKVYSRLLHDYEQVYFHGNRGLPIPPPPGTPRCDSR